MRNNCSVLVRFGFVTLLLCSTTVMTHAATIVVSSTIQAAVDSAQPGDTVFVPPGIYRENVVVNRNNITIRGGRAAILDGEALAGNNGIRVAAATPGGRINGFRLEGLTIRNYSENGVFLIRVDNFTISDGSYKNNKQYGIYPVRSTNGLVEDNRTSGSEDAGVYIGQSDSVVIRKNYCHGNLIGIEIENSTHVEAADNLTINNSVGIAVSLLPNLSIKITENILLKSNISVNNNRPNLISDPNEIFSALPGGVGILVLGGDRVRVRENVVVNNDSSGIGVVRVPSFISDLDPGIDPLPDHNLIIDNTVLHNGTNPDVRIAPLPGVDLTWDMTGTGNHWVNNRFQTSFPVPLP